MQQFFVVALAACLAATISASALAAWVTESVNSRQYTVPLGTACADAEVDRTQDATGRVRSYHNVQIKPGVTVPFACKQMADPAPVPAPTPAPAPPPSSSMAFSTAFDMADWQQGQAFPPSDATGGTLSKHGDWTTGNGNRDRIFAEANRPGSIGKGFRHYRGNGQNNNGGAISVSMNAATPELWMRFYMRYQAGFAWVNGAPIYTKEHYWHGSGNPIFGIQGAHSWGVHAVGVNHSSSRTWSASQGGNVGDGQWHCYEYHVRQNGTAGLLEIWIDGIQYASKTANMGSSPLQSFTLGSNQAFPVGAGLADYYTDYDDIAISTMGRVGCL